MTATTSATSFGGRYLESSHVKSTYTSQRRPKWDPLVVKSTIKPFSFLSPYLQIPFYISLQRCMLPTFRRSSQFLASKSLPNIYKTLPKPCFPVVTFRIPPSFQISLPIFATSRYYRKKAIHYPKMSTTTESDILERLAGLKISHGEVINHKSIGGGGKEWKEVLDGEESLKGKEYKLSKTVSSYFFSRSPEMNGDLWLSAVNTY